MKLDVPYHSQFLDVTDPYWMPRACGLSALKMMLDYYGKDAPDIVGLAEAAKRDGGYGATGLVHDYVVEVAKRHGLESHREEKMDEREGVAALERELRAGHPVIVSAVKLILGQTKFHMVVLTGFEEEGGALSGFYFHEPESTDREAGSHVFVPLPKFLKSWRKMAIFMAPKTGLI